MYSFVYETPCGGTLTGLMRLSSEGWAEIIPIQNLGGDPNGLHPDVPTGDWKPMTNLGTFDTPQEMLEVINRREGWSLVPA